MLDPKQVVESFDDTRLRADTRLCERSAKVLKSWRAKPGLAFPEVFEEDAELEGAYRFFRNPKLTFEKLLEPHQLQTVRRCEQEQEVLVAHDTTAFCFNGDTGRTGLGRINKNNRGFLAHPSLAISMDGVPLGILEAKIFTRPLELKKKVKSSERRKKSDCESHRWLKQAELVEKRLPASVSAIHVMDREGDIYDCFSTLVEGGHRFVIRYAKNRLTAADADEPKLKTDDVLEDLPIRFKTEIKVARRAGSNLPDQQKLYPSRKGRKAKLSVSSTRVEIKRTRASSSSLPRTSTLNLVRVFEADPPKESPAVDWTLMTTEPIQTKNQLLRVIEIYRQRWKIEELFKAIKTGCAFEKRRLGSLHALTNALAMVFPIAVDMLLLRSQTRNSTNIPAYKHIDPMRLEILRIFSKRFKLSENPTVAEVGYAIAGLGGYLKRKEPPGWLTLQRGFKRLIQYEAAIMEGLEM